MESLYPPQTVLSFIGYEHHPTSDARVEGRLDIQLKVPEIIGPLLDIVPNEEAELMDESLLNSTKRIESLTSSQLTVGKLKCGASRNEGTLVTAEYATSGPLADDISPTADFQLRKREGKGQLDEEVVDQQRDRNQTEARGGQINKTVITVRQKSSADSLHAMSSGTIQGDPVIEKT